MCAIIGWNQSTPGILSAEDLATLIKRAESSGRHSAGMAITAPDGSIKVFKKAGTPSDFVRSYGERLEQFVQSKRGMAHTRWATHGDINNRNAHPFVHLDSDGWAIPFVHNGVISNYRQFTPDAEVDSECLGPLIIKRKLSAAVGSAAVIWAYKGDLFCFRNSQRLAAASWEDETDKKRAITLVLTDIDYAKGLKSLEGMKMTKWLLRPGTAWKVTPQNLLTHWVEEGKERETEFSLSGYNGG